MIYENMTFADYLKIPALNSSTLKPYVISPRKGFYEQNKESESKEAFKIGRLVHSLTLEGEEKTKEEIRNNYITSGFPVNPNTKKPYGQDTQKFKKWHDEQGNKDILTDIEFNTIKKIVRAIKNNKEAVKLLDQSPYRETVLTWTCRFTGHKCKAMIDAHSKCLAGDLKTISKQLTKSNLEREIYNRSYHLQFAFYRDGLKANNINAEDFFVIFAQSQDEYDVASFYIDEETLHQGQNNYLKAIKNYNIAYSDNSEFKKGIYKSTEIIGIPHYLINYNEDIEEDFLISEMMEAGYEKKNN